MTKEIIEKISSPRTPLDIDDISVEEKKRLAFFLAEKGLKASTFYLRFFQKGFFEWEIIGIKTCKNIFLNYPEVKEILTNYIDHDYPYAQYKGALYEMAQSSTPGCFYHALRKVNAGLCRKFFIFMEEKGMCACTALKRFASDDWKPWEVEGMQKLLTHYGET